MFASSVGSEHREGVTRVVPVGDGIVAICLDGEFDLANAPTLSDEIDRALKGGNDVILDLNEATFIDSSFIRVLLDAVNTVDGKNQTIVLQLGTAAVVERVLQIAGIEQVLARAHDRQEAMEIIQQHAETM